MTDEQLSAEERAQRMVESIMRTMTQFGTPRPIPPEYWFEDQIRQAEHAAAEKAREEVIELLSLRLTRAAIIRRICDAQAKEHQASADDHRALKERKDG